MNEMRQSSTLLNLLNKYLEDNSLKEARNMFEDNRFRTLLQNDCADVVTLLATHMTEENFVEKPCLYNCCEFLLIQLAKEANPQDAIFEFLEIVETASGDNIVISTLKALQISLLKQPEKKALSLEWVLHAILTYIQKMEFPEKWIRAFNEEEFMFLENNDQVSRIVRMNLTTLLFVEPIEKEISKASNQNSLRNNDVTRRNALICFLLSLLDTHLNRIYIVWDTKSATNTYIKQCRETIVKHLNNLVFQDPFYFLNFIEDRIRFPLTFETKAQEDNFKTNVFLLEAKCPLMAFGHYFHFLFSRREILEKSPKIYNKFFVFEKTLYLVSEMLKVEDEHIQIKAIELGKGILDSLLDSYYNNVPESYLELTIFEDIFNNLIRLVVFSENERIRKTGVKYLDSLIMKFNDPGRMIILENLFNTQIENAGLLGYLTIVYKNMVVEKLNKNSDQLPKEYSGTVFERMISKFICHLPQEEKSDLVDLSDRIVAALNFIRFLSIRDRKNQTTFWGLKFMLEKGFLAQLRLGLDLSRAHYKQKVKDIDNDQMDVDEGVEISIKNEFIPELTKEQKMIAMNNCLNKIDLMDSLLCRVQECLSNVPEETS